MRYLAPFLAGIYFVLALAAQNSAELVRLEDLGRPVAIALLVAGLGWLTGRLLISSPSKTSLWATALVAGFSTFGIVIQSAWRGGLLRNPALVDWLLVLLLLGLAWLALWLRRTPRPLAAAAQYVTVVYALLVTWTVTRLVLQAVRPLSAGVAAADSAVAIPRPASELPDIYLIVLDKYTGSGLLRAHYGFDNSRFEEALRSRNFIVPQHARANYVNTFLALAAMLNLRYMDDLPDRFGRENPSRALTYPMVEDNTLVRFLKRQGYRFVFFPTAFGPTRQNRLADLNLPDPSSIQAEFFTAWRSTTVIPMLHKWACTVLGCVVDRLPMVPESASLLDWKLDRLAGLTRDQRPTFAFLHLAVPHEPYHYRADCQHRSPFWPPRDDGDWEPAVKAAYVSQIQCVNRKLLALVDSIQSRSTVAPVILFQSDHGHGRLGRSLPDLPDVASDRAAERLAVFAAYALPGVSAVEVWDSITPVNVTRLLLRHYFAADFPPIEDRSYWSPLEHPFRLTRVTANGNAR